MESKYIWAAVGAIAGFLAYRHFMTEDVKDEKGETDRKKIPEKTEGAKK